jgi:hypothetical protein
VPPEAPAQFKATMGKRGAEARAAWEKLWADYQKKYPELATELKQMWAHELPAGWDSELPVFPASEKGDATRNAGQEFGQQLQGFANDPVGQMQSTTNNIRVATEQALGTARNQSPQVANPFAATSSQPAATGARRQGTVAPPPWPQTGAQNSAPVANASNRDQTAARGMTPIQTQTGWTSIGSNVAAPPLIIPQPTSTSTSAAPLRMANGGPSFPASSWDTNAATTPATIGRAGNPPAAGNTAQHPDYIS